MALSARGATDWLRAIPSDYELTLDNTSFLTALKMYLGLEILPPSPMTCLCGKSVDKYGIHLMACKHNGGAIARHDVMCDELSILARKARVLVTKEPVCLHNKRLDLMLSGMCERGQDMVVDVKIVFWCQLKLYSKPSTLLELHSLNKLKGCNF